MTAARISEESGNVALMHGMHQDRRHNPAYGHGTGDDLLMEMSIRLGDLLRKMDIEGCREAQGFLLGRPMPDQQAGEMATANERSVRNTGSTALRQARYPPGPAR